MASCGAHCRACDRCFSGTKAFDAHRAGSFRDGERHCLDPEGVEKLTARPGACRVDRRPAKATVYGSPDRET